MRVGVTGFKGRMGQLLVEEIETAEDMNFAGGIDMGDDAEALFEKADAIIDFSVPDATITHARLAARNNTALIIGTTGLSPKQEQQLNESAKETAILYAANMSVGITMLSALVEQTANRLGIEWDIEVFETHHNQKIDSPSGTALALGNAAKKGRNGGEFIIDRKGKRNAGDIGYAVQRGGDIVGEHDVTFFSQGERITLGHKATDRRLFAKGAIRATRWIKDKPAGIYSMRDVLDL